MIAARSFREVQLGVSDAQFVRLRALIERVAGIYLADSKKPLLIARLGQRVRELELRDFSAYYDRVVGDEAECRLMLDRISTNETHFFREPHHFEFLAQREIPRWLDEARAGRRSRHLNVWSAGCSTGEEPYSVAMQLASLLDGWDISILATDISSRVLARAREGVYTAERAASIPDALRRTYMLRGVGSQVGNVKVTADVRARVRFDRVNLTDDELRVGRAFDLILCRNVLIYFRPTTRAGVLDRLISRLAPGGHLFLGHAESLPTAGLPMRAVMPTVYQRTEEI